MYCKLENNLLPTSFEPWWCKVIIFFRITISKHQQNYFFLKINHSLMTKLKMPEKIKANRLHTTTLKPAK